jgi:hypothetical protein
MGEDPEGLRPGEGIEWGRDFTLHKFCIIEKYFVKR